MNKSTRIGLVISVFLTTCFSILSARAQTPAITLTVGLFHYSANDGLRSRLDQFQAAYPGITVTTVDLPAIQNELITDPKKHVDEITHFAASADVLQTVPDLINEADSRAGYFLNIKPLVDQDSTLQASDYYPAAWRSWLWDNAQWGIPVTAEPIVMVYDPAAFDNAGLAYPNANWTAEDLVKAINALHVKAANGSVSQPAIDVTALTMLYASLIGTPLIDPNNTPNPPNLDQPGVTALLAGWQPIYASGELSHHDPAVSPMQINDFHAVLPTKADPRKLAVSLLPGGRAGLISWGYALSGGTQHPQEAYELARFLADDPSTIQQGDSFPARVSAGQAAIAQLPDPLPQIAQSALDKAIPTGDLRYAEYLDVALAALKNNTVSAADALAIAQSQAESDLKIAANVPNAHIALTVATPIPDPTAVPGKITLKFGITSGLIQRSNSQDFTLNNIETWKAVAAEFARTDPEVGQIQLDPSFNPATNNDDCFYQAIRLFNSAGLKYLLPIDPLTETDPTFDPSNFIGTILTQSKYDGKLWLYPLNIQPGILTYDPKALAQANVPLPTNGWTIDQFVDALKQLRAQSGQPAFTMNRSNLPLLMLIADYGGVPIDYRTDPMTLNYTDSANLNAIQQVLDLAKAGYIGYVKQDDPASIGQTGSTAPIQGDVLSASSFRNGIGGQSSYQITMFPTGSHYSPLSYNIGSVALNATTPYASACYRWIKALEHHPELFGAMPVLRSALNDPNLVNTQGNDLVALYKRIAAQLDSPNTIAFPSDDNGHTFTQFFTEHWLYTAFDSYVLANGDLPSALKQAHDEGVGFSECIKTVPAYQPGAMQNMYLKDIAACVIKVDPGIASDPMFAPLFSGN